MLLENKEVFHENMGIWPQKLSENAVFGAYQPKYRLFMEGWDQARAPTS